jgi:hypothetical protein
MLQSELERIRNTKNRLVKIKAQLLDYRAKDFPDISSGFRDGIAALWKTPALLKQYFDRVVEKTGGLVWITAATLKGDLGFNSKDAEDKFKKYFVNTTGITAYDLYQYVTTKVEDKDKRWLLTRLTDLVLRSNTTQEHAKIIDQCIELSNEADKQLGVYKDGASSIHSIDLSEYSGTTISGMSASIANKFARIPLLSEFIPTYQHMGRSNISVTMSLQTENLEIVSELRRLELETSIAQQMRDLITPIELQKFIPGSVVAVTGNAFFSMLGVHNVVVGNVQTSTVPNRPGLCNVTIEFIQADYVLHEHEQIQPYNILPANLVAITAKSILDAGDTKVVGWLNTIKNSKPDLYNQLDWEVMPAYNGVLDLIKEYGQQINYDVVNKLTTEATATAPPSTKSNVLSISGTTSDNFWQSAVERAEQATPRPYTIGSELKKVNTLSFLSRANIVFLVVMGHITLWQTIRILLSNRQYRTDLKEMLQTLVPNPEKIVKIYEDSEVYITDRERAAHQGRCALPDILQIQIPGSPPNKELYTPGDLYFYRDYYINKQVVDLAESIIECEHGLLTETFHDLLTIDLAKTKDLLAEYRVKLESSAADIKGLGATNKQLLLKHDQLLKMYNDLEATYKKYEDTRKLPLGINIEAIEGSTNISPAMLYKYQELLIGMESFGKVVEAVEAGKEYNYEVSKPKPDANRLKMLEKRYNFLSTRILAGMNSIDVLDSTFNPEVGSVGASEGLRMISKTLGALPRDVAETERGILNDVKVAMAADSTFSLSRAFPAVKIYLIEKDSPAWILFDDFYSYNAVVSIDVLKNAYSASETAIIRLSNVTNNLANTTSKNYERHGLQDTASEQTVFSIDLKPGADIALKYGYEADPSQMPFKFRGTIVEVSPGPITEIVAQSAGAQLNQVPYPVKDKKAGLNSTTRSLGNVALSVLDDMPGRLRGLGGWGLDQAIQKNVDSNRSDSKEEWAELAQKLIGMPRPIGASSNVGENIFLPFGFSFIPLWPATESKTSKRNSGNNFDWVCSAGKTGWELLQDIALYNRDYIVKVPIYNAWLDPRSVDCDLRYTVYLGPRDGVYKSSSKSTETSEAAIRRIVDSFDTNFASAKEQMKELPKLLKVVDKRLSAKQATALLMTKGFVPLVHSDSPDNTNIWGIDFSGAVDYLYDKQFLVTCLHTYDKDLGAAATSGGVWRGWAHKLIKVSPPNTIEVFPEALDKISEQIKEQLKIAANVSASLLGSPIPPEQSGLTHAAGVYEPIIRKHLVDSYHHIISNGLVASSNNFYNRLRLIYPNAEPIGESKMRELELDHELSHDVRIDKATIDAIKLYLGTINTGLREAVVSIDDDINPDQIKEQILWYGNIDTNFYDSPWVLRDSSPSGYNVPELHEEQLTRLKEDGGVAKPWFVAAQALAKLAARMYSGSLVLVGNPNIEPFDEVYLTDVASDMFGPIVVEQVHDHIDGETGFTTTITPNAYIRVASLANSFNQSYMSNIGKVATATSMLKLGENILGGIAAYGIAKKAAPIVAPAAGMVKASATGALSSAANSVKEAIYAYNSLDYGRSIGLNPTGVKQMAVFNNVKKVGGALSRLSLKTIGTYILAFKVVSDSHIQYAQTFNRMMGTLFGRQAIDVVPVWYRGEPLLAGMDGAMKNDWWTHAQYQYYGKVLSLVDKITEGT